VIVHGDVGQIGPGALVAVLTPLDVVPAVLIAREVVRIGNRLGILVADDDAVSVEDAVPKLSLMTLTEFIPQPPVRAPASSR